jgi:hypothetical protein
MGKELNMGPGEQTLDLISLRKAHPAEDIATGTRGAGDRPTIDDSERIARQYGTVSLFIGPLGGLAIISAVFLLRDRPPLATPFMSFSALMFCFSIAAACLQVGLIERLNRYGRTLVRANTLQLAEVIRQVNSTRSRRLRSQPCSRTSPTW